MGRAVASDLYALLMTEPYPDAPPPVKRWYQRWWVWVIVGVVVLVVIPIGACTAIVGTVVTTAAIVGAGGDQDEPDGPGPTFVESEGPEVSDSPEPAVSESPEPSDEPAESADPEPSESDESLADEVWENVEANYGGPVPSSSPLFAVTDVEDVSSGTIRVFVQETLTDAGREEIARQVFSLGAWDLIELDTIVVQDASGVDSNHYRRDFPAIPQP